MTGAARCCHAVPVTATSYAPPEPSPLSRALRFAGLVRSFVDKDLRTRYVGSGMGFFWTVIDPLIELLTYTFVFTVILKVRFQDNFSLGVNALYLFAGMVPWFTISESLTRCTNVVRENHHLIHKVRFPAALLPTYVVLSETFNQVIRFGVLFAAVLLIGHGLSWHIVLLLPVLVLQTAFVLGVGMLLATTQVYFKDTRQLLAPALMIWLFITPIFYPASLFPARFAPVLMFNPLSHLVGIYRELILNHRPPHPGSLIIFGTSAVLVFALGYATFKRHEREFPDLV